MTANRATNLCKRASLFISVSVLGMWACAGGQPEPTMPPPGAPATVQMTPPSSPVPAATEAPSAAPSAAASAAPVAAPPVPTSAVANAKTESAWAPCHQSYKASAKDVSKDVAAMAKACEKTTKMKLIGKTVTGKQADQDTPQTVPLDAKANHCYRVYAQAVEGIKDLDLAVKDSAGIVVGQDSTDDPSPVVLEDGAVCFTKDDKATIVMSVGMGSGAYAVQVWGD
jgi:hypothetical protein